MKKQKGAPCYKALKFRNHGGGDRENEIQYQYSTLFDEEPAIDKNSFLPFLAQNQHRNNDSRHFGKR